MTDLEGSLKKKKNIRVECNAVKCFDLFASFLYNTSVSLRLSSKVAFNIKAEQIISTGLNFLFISFLLSDIVNYFI